MDVRGQKRTNREAALRFGAAGTKSEAPLRFNEGDAPAPSPVQCTSPMSPVELRFKG
jgi:hypothetical protein